MIKILGNRVLVKPVEALKKTKTGIILPDDAVKESNEGVVITIGTGKLLENGERILPDVLIGDTIVYSSFGGTDLEFEGTTYKLLSNEDIVGVK